LEEAELGGGFEMRALPPQPITPEERQAILDAAPKLVKYGIDMGWIKPPKKEPLAWYQKKPQPDTNALS
jgi:hypothetical protein